jgi:hypothetical protein
MHYGIQMLTVEWTGKNEVWKTAIKPLHYRGD